MTRCQPHKTQTLRGDTHCSGNTRAVVDEQGQLVQQSSYYPFGLQADALTWSSDMHQENEYLYNAEKPEIFDFIVFRASTKNDKNHRFFIFRDGKELQDDFGLDWYDYGFRFYDPALARWHVPDPKAEKYFDHSQYNYVLNNPLNYIDPMGDTVKFAGADEKAAYNNYKSKVTSRVAKYDKRTQKLRDKGKTKRADKRDAKRANNTYVQIQGELNNLESSETIFRVNMGDNISNEAGGGNLSFNSSTSEIDVNIGSGGNFSTIENMSHELLHAYQFLSGDLDLTVNGFGGMLYDKKDEIAAFRRQNLFVPPGKTGTDPSIVYTHPDYKDLPSGPKSFHLFTPQQQSQYKNLNNIIGLRYIYPGWKNDYKK